jgi:hypothetical protein
VSTTLEEILKRLDSAQKMANIDPDDPVYTKTRAGIEVAVRQAKEDLVRLRRDYERKVLETGVAIFLYGPADKAKVFGQLVSEMGEAVVIDASEIYTNIAKRIEPSLGHGRQLTAEHISMLHAALMEVAREVGVHLTRPAKLTRMEIIPDFESLVAYVRDELRGNFGDEMNAAYLQLALGREGLKIRYMGSTSPVIILNAVPDEAVGLGQAFGKGRANIEIGTDDTIDKEYIVKTFKNVQKQIKNKK